MCQYGRTLRSRLRGARSVHPGSSVAANGPNPVKKDRMTDSADALDRDDTRGFRMLFRASRDATLLRIVGRDAGGAGKSSSGGEQFVLAVPVDIDDLLVSRLLELHERNRTREPEAEHGRLRFAGWEFDLLERHLAAPDGSVARLPGLEFALLRVFVTQPRHIFSRPELAMLTSVGGRLYSSVRSIDCYVSRLRRRLGLAGGAALISTVRTIGYCFEADVVRK